MAMSDTISDMLTRIRNGSKARKNAVDVPASNLKRDIARLLKKNHFIRDILEIPDNKQGILRIYLKYSKEDEPIIRGLERVSRPGLRRYLSLEDIKRIVNTRVGVTIISTSRGIMTDAEALKARVGGEALCNVW